MVKTFLSQKKLLYVNIDAIKGIYILKIEFDDGKISIHKVVKD